jgi:hypothetical protein
MVEALYFKTYYSFLKGDLPNTQMFFDFLVDEFNKRKNPGALSKKQLKELKSIRSAIKTGKIEGYDWVIESSLCIVDINPSPDIKQTELTRKIHFEGLSQLQELLNVSDLELYNVEHPCGVYGAVDMVYRCQNVAFPLEVKVSEGKHDLIGQINKYALYFKMQMHMKNYDEVQPVTICNNYNQHTLTELKRLSVITLKYDLTDNGIKIKRM